MVCAVLAFPLPLEKHFHHILALRFTANQKQRGEMQHKKRHSQLPPRQLTSVCSSHSVWKGGNHTQYRQKKTHQPTNALCIDPAGCWAPPSPLAMMGAGSAQALARLSVIPALPRLDSAPRTQTAWESLSDFSGSPHTSAFLLHTPVPVKYSRHSSLPCQYAAKSLTLSLF